MVLKKQETVNGQRRREKLLEKLQHYRINQQSLNTFMSEIARLIAATKNDVEGDEVNILFYEPVPYKLYREAWEHMPNEFKKTCPLSFYMSMQDTPVENIRSEKIRDVLLSLVECYEDREKLCYQSGEYSDVISMPNLMAVLEQDYINDIVKGIPAKIMVSDKMLITEPIRNAYKKYIEEQIRLSVSVCNGVVRVQDIMRINAFAKFRALKNNINPSECTLSHGAINSHMCKGKDHLTPQDFAKYAANTAGTRSYLFFPKFIARLFEYLWEIGELKEKNKMPFWNFAKFLIMYRGISFASARRFFFNLLDLNGDGSISRMESDQFFTDIYEVQKTTKTPYVIPKLDTEADYNLVWSSWIDVLGLSSTHKEVVFDDVKHNPYAEHFLLMLTNEDRFEMLEESKDGIKDTSLRMQTYAEDTQYPPITDEQLMQDIFD